MTWLVVMFWAIYPFLLPPFFPFQTLPPFLRWWRHFFFLQNSKLRCWFSLLSNFLYKCIFSPIFLFAQKIKKELIWLFIQYLWVRGREVIVSVTIVPPTAVAAAQAAYCGQQPPWGFYSGALDAAEERRGKKTNICCGRGCFQSGLEPLNDSHGQFPERLRGTNTS